MADEVKKVFAKMEDAAKSAVKSVEDGAKKVESVFTHQVKAEIEYVQMFRHADHFPPPHTAQVHPAEVQNYAKGGWMTEEQFRAEGEAEAKRAK